MDCYDPTQEFGGCGCNDKNKKNAEGDDWSMHDRGVHDDTVPADRVESLTEDARGSSGQELWNHFFDHAEQWGADGYSRGATYWALMDVKEDLDLGPNPDLVQVLNEGHAEGYSG